MLGKRLVGLIGLTCVVACSSTTHDPGATAQGGTGSSGDAGAAEGGTSAGTSSAGGKASGGSESSTGGDLAFSGDPTTAKGFCDGYYAIVAELFGKCWGLSAQQAQMLFAESRLCDDFLAGVDQHRIGFDGSHGAACLSELHAALMCDGVAEDATAPNCEAVIQPLVQEGQACSPLQENALGRQCAGDTFCQTATTYACTGVCAATSPVGTACDPLTTDVRCAADATCDSVTKKCVTEPPRAKLNEACGSASLGTCQSGLWCDIPDGAVAGTCVAKKTSGPCKDMTECVRSKTCAGPMDARSCVDPKPIGASCTPGNLECNILSRCGQDQKCVDAEGRDGDPCGKQPDGEPAYCARGLYCDGPVLGTGVCHPAKASGASCSGASIGECAGELGHCDSTTKTCAACE